MMPPSNVFEEFPLLAAISQPEEMFELLRSLPEETVADEYESDERFFESVFKKLREEKLIDPIDLKTLAGIPRMILSLILKNRRPIFLAASYMLLTASLFRFFCLFIRLASGPGLNPSAQAWARF